MFDFNKIVKDFELDMETSETVLNAIQEWAAIYNGNPDWLDGKTISLHVAKTISEKVSESVVNEFKSTCSEPYLNDKYQRFLKNIQKNTELMVGKSMIFFKPYFDGTTIRINVIQADKFIPVSFDDTGELLSCITIDQIIDGKKVYTRLEYNELKDGNMYIKNIAYKGTKNGNILENKIPLSSVEKWADIDEEGVIEGVEHLIGGFATMPLVNELDNNSPIGVPCWYKATNTLREIDKQFTRTMWEYEGTELAIDVDETVLSFDSRTGSYKAPKGKERLFRKLSFQSSEKDKSYNVFSPEIRDTSLFNGLNELLRIAESQCHLEHGTLCKAEISPKTAQEIKQMKQTFYTTIKNVQSTMQSAFDDLLYGMYVIAKLYGIPVQSTYTTEYDWDDSVLVDKDSERNTALLERNNGITSDVQYIMDTKHYKEEEAIEYIKKQQEYRKLTEVEEEQEVDEE